MKTVPVILGCLITPLAVGLAQPAVDHPTLVDLESTSCTACHGDLLEGRATTHPVATDDCTTCHEMSVSSAGTRVAMVEQEPALCLMCHDELTSAAEAELEVPHYPVTESCLVCHDPHATDETHLLSAPSVELCTACHETGEIQDTHGGQLTRSVDCVSCHLPHGSSNPGLLIGRHQHRPFADGSCNGCHRAPSAARVRLRSRGERLCSACHSDLDEAPGENGSVHAALKGKRGRAGCLSCHDPHMSAERALLLETGPELCAGCHEELVLAATADTGHAPAAEDCTSCHQPHTSAQAGLLDVAAAELCRGCHDIEDADLSAAHLNTDLDRLDCLTCHTPHGSGHPKLLAATLHPPILDGCDTCHEGSANEVMENGESSLCLICHEDVGEFAEQAEVPHAALEVAVCADCHNPHASAQAALVKSPGGAVCTECHEDQVAGADEVAHGVIAQFGCEACHEPHGSRNAQLLRIEGSELCLSCHDPGRLPGAGEDGVVKLLGQFELTATAARDVASLRLSGDGLRGHPVPQHRVLGMPTKEEMKRKNVDSTYSGEFTCLTCHDPHKGRSEDIFRWDATSSMQVCLQCHPK